MNVSFDKVVHVELSSKVALNDELIYRTLEIVTSDGKKYEVTLFACEDKYLTIEA